MHAYDYSLPRVVSGDTSARNAAGGAGQGQHGQRCTRAGRRGKQKFMQQQCRGTCWLTLGGTTEVVSSTSASNTVNVRGTASVKRNFVCAHATMPSPKPGHSRSPNPAVRHGGWEARRGMLTLVSARRWIVACCEISSCQFKPVHRGLDGSRSH